MTGAQSTHPTSKLSVAVVALAFFALWLAGAFLFLAVWNLVSLDKTLHNFTSRSYPHTTGTVTATSIGEGTTRTGKNGTVVPSYEPKIRYTFEVGGKAYEGNRIDYSHTVQLARADAESILTKYTVGSKVDIYYDPKRPQTAALVRGLDGWDMALAFVNGLWLVGVCVWWLGFVWLRRQRAALSSQ